MSIATHEMQSIVWPKSHKLAKEILLVLFGSCFIALSSQVTIPMQPVPYTLQTFAIMLIAMTYGSRLGVMTVLAYIIEGAAGLPVFAGWSSIYTVGASFGYIIGFLPAVFVTGFLMERGFAGSMIKSFFAGLSGNVLVFVFGVPVLAGFVGWHNAFTLGLIPFIASELIKLIVFAAITPRLWKKAR